MGSIRPVLLVAGIILVGVALYLFSKFRGITDADGAGLPWVVGSIIALVGAVACGIGWLLTKPRDNMEDISITKF